MSHQHHEHLVQELADMLGPVLEHSSQAIYLYLDDTHKICNQKFADLLGYDSIQEWVDNQTPVSDVLEGDQSKIIEAYGEASRNFNASQVSVNLVAKDGTKKKVNVIMVPVSYHEEVFVLHFIS